MTVTSVTASFQRMIDREIEAVLVCSPPPAGSQSLPDQTRLPRLVEGSSQHQHHLVPLRWHADENQFCGADGLTHTDIHGASARGAPLADAW